MRQWARVCVLLTVLQSCQAPERGAERDPLPAVHSLGCRWPF